MSKLKEFFKEEVLPKLEKEFGITNIHEVPKLEKIVINSRLNSSWTKDDNKRVHEVITAVTGQSPVFVKAKKSISNFKLREGMSNSVVVTLRGEAMYEFFYKLVNLVLPNKRDFRGQPKKVNGRTYNMGIDDLSIFPEVSTSEAGKNQLGCDIAIVTTASSAEQTVKLLEYLGMPFRGKIAN